MPLLRPKRFGKLPDGITPYHRDFLQWVKESLEILTGAKRSQLDTANPPRSQAVIFGDLEESGLIDSSGKAITYASAIAIRDSARNLIVKNNITNPTYQIDIDADEVVLQKSDGTPLRVASVDLTVDLTTTGANGLDTGTETATAWYHLFIISNGTTTSGLISLSDTAPSLPAGYDYMAYVGAARNATDLLSFSQVGNRVACGSKTAVSDGTANSWAAGSVNLSSIIPLTAKKVNGLADLYASEAAKEIIYLGPDSYMEYDAFGINFAASGYQFFGFSTIIATAQTMKYYIWTSAGTPKVNIYINGWEY